jgi:glycosyltransferase involved in cell wall biosynthesis
MTHPLVSIVTPSYNQAIYLEQTILSVIHQTYPRIEFIVVDGGSTDSSIELIKKYQDKIDFWTSARDKGQTDAINIGFKQASGDIFAWLNSDDVYQPEAVEEAVDYLSKNPDVGLVYGDANIIDNRGRVIGKFNAQQTSYQRLRRGGVYIPQPAAFWRACLWKKVGPLDPSYYFAMDYDLWVRLAKVSELKYLKGHTWASFRVHGQSKTITSDSLCWDEMLRIHRRDGGSWFSILVAKYWIRKLIAPLWNRWRHRKLIEKKKDEG